MDSLCAPASLVDPQVIQAMKNLASSTPTGNFVEVGVYKGGTAWHLAEVAKSQNRDLYLYDTFSGIPHRGDLDSHRVGDFSDTSVETVRNRIPYAQVIQGIFPQTMVPMGDISFAHLDCDQYQSVFESSQALIPFMVKGGIIWFDDVFCLEGATEAFKQLFSWPPHTVCGKAIVRF